MPPKIDKIETLRLEEFPNILWVRIHTNDGRVGLGETFFGAAAAEAYIIETAAPLLLGEDPRRIEFLRKKLRPYVGFQAAGAEMRGNSAIDIALWDLWGRSTNQPLYQLLGGRSRDWVRTYNTCAGYRYVRSHRTGQNTANWGLGTTTGPYEDLDAFLNRADELAHDLLESGIDAMKIWPFDPYAEASDGLSIAPADLRKGLEPFEKIRRAVGDRMQIMLECHSLWSLPAAITLARAVEPLDIYWIEDPIQMNGLASLADFKRQTTLKVTASETIASRQGFRDLMTAGAVDIVMLDISWVGGLSEAKAIAGMAEAFHLPVAPHDCTGPVVYTASTHLSVSAPNALVQESVRAFYTGWYTELVTGLPEFDRGRVRPPDGPGLGIELLPGLESRPDAIRRQLSTTDL